MFVNSRLMLPNDWTETQYFNMAGPRSDNPFVGEVEMVYKDVEPFLSKMNEGILT